MTKMRRPTETENKLLLLYAADKLGPTTAQQLLVFMVENDAMDYVSIQIGLAELTESGLLRRRAHAAGQLYALSEDGKETLRMFAGKIPHSRAVPIDEAAETFKIRFRRELEMPSSFEKVDEGQYVVRLSLLEQEISLLSLSVNVPTHKIAQQFCDAWSHKASDVFAHIMHTLGEADLQGKDAE